MWRLVGGGPSRCVRRNERLVRRVKNTLLRWKPAAKTILLQLLLACVVFPLIGGGVLLVALRSGWIAVDAFADISAGEAQAARWLRRWASESKYQAVAGEVPVNHENVVTGSLYYKEYCSQCHGGSGAGSILEGARFNPPPPHLDDLRKSSDKELFWYAKRGIRLTGMPAFQETLSDEALWQIAIFLKEHHQNKEAMDILQASDSTLR